MAGQYAALIEALDELVHGQEGVELALAEPHTGKLVGNLPLISWVGLKLVSVVEAVVHDRRIHAAAQVLQVTLQRGPRYFDLLQHRLETDAATSSDQHLRS